MTARNTVFYTAVAKATVFEEAHLEGARFVTGAWIEGARIKGRNTCRRMWRHYSAKAGKFPQE